MKERVAKEINDIHYRRGLRDGLDKAWAVLWNERSKDESGAVARSIDLIFEELESLAPERLKDAPTEDPHR